MISAPPRILHRFDVQAFFGEEARVLGDPDRQMGDGRRSAVVDAPQLLPEAGGWAKRTIPKNVIQKMADWILK